MQINVLCKSNSEELFGQATIEEVELLPTKYSFSRKGAVFTKKIRKLYLPNRDFPLEMWQHYAIAFEENGIRSSYIVPICSFESNDIPDNWEWVTYLM